MEVSNQYGRVKGAEWFSALYKKDILVLGAGGIGSWLALLLSRVGCNLHIFDMDVYEEHNMTGQAVLQSGVGKLKTEALVELMEQFSPDATISAYGEYTEESMTNEIVLCGFDNMKARRIAFDNWQEHVAYSEEEEKKNMLFIDGRLNAEHMQIFCIRGDDEKSIKKYDEEFLFSDEEVGEQDCTFKQTSHCAAMIASKMVAFLTNFFVQGRSVPFFYEYFPPINYTS